MPRSGIRAAVAVILATLAVVAVIVSVSDTETLREDAEVHSQGLTTRLLNSDREPEEQDPREATKLLASNAHDALIEHKNAKETAQEKWASKLQTMLNDSDNAHQRGQERMHKTLEKATRDARQVQDEDEDEDDEELSELAQTLHNQARVHPAAAPESAPMAATIPEDKAVPKKVVQQLSKKDRDVSGSDLDMLRAPDPKIAHISNQMEEATQQILSSVSPDHENKLKNAQKAANEAKTKYLSAFKEVKAKKDDKQLSAQRHKAQNMVSDPRHFDFTEERKTKAEKNARAQAVEKAQKTTKAAKVALASKQKHDELSNKDRQIALDKANEKAAKAKLFKLSTSATDAVKEQELEVKEPAQVTEQKDHSEDIISSYVEGFSETSMEKGHKSSEKKAADAASKAMKKQRQAEAKLKIVTLEESQMKMKKSHQEITKQDEALKQQLQTEKESHQNDAKQLQERLDSAEEAHKAQMAAAQKAAQDTQDRLSKMQQQLAEVTQSARVSDRKRKADDDSVAGYVDQISALGAQKKSAVSQVSTLVDKLREEKMQVLEANQATQKAVESQKRKDHDANMIEDGQMQAQQQAMADKNQAQAIQKASTMKMEARAMNEKAQAMMDRAKRMEANSEKLLAQQKEEEAKAQQEMEKKLAALKLAEANENSAAKNAKTAAQAEEKAADQTEAQQLKQKIDIMKDQMAELEQKLEDEKSHHKQDSQQLDAQKAETKKFESMEANSEKLLAQQKEEEAKSQQEMEKKLAALKLAEANENSAAKNAKTAAQAEEKAEEASARALKHKAGSGARPVIAVAPKAVHVVSSPSESRVLKETKKVADQDVAAENVVVHKADAAMAQDEDEAEGAMDDLMRLAGDDDKAADPAAAEDVVDTEMLETNVPTKTEMNEDEDLFDVDSLMSEAETLNH